MPYLATAALLLAAAVLAVPLFRRLGLGAVLGYLAAGALIGPYGLGLIGEGERILHLAEFGIVLLLFLIGLELQPRRLWSMRRAVFGLGAAQVLGTGALLGLIGLALGLEPAAAALVGPTLALSSTAFALQTLAERGELAQRHGRIAFAVLLFQDLAALPLLALIPLLAPGGEADAALGWPRLLGIAAVLALLLGGGRHALRLLYRMVARAGAREAMTASALLTVVTIALLMQAVGLSAALGAFVAGMLLADSEYRHELQADIEPFEGLLLGLFFIAIGMTANLALLVEHPLRVLALALGLALLKAALLYALGRSDRLAPGSALRFALVLSQGGEFGFVVFTAAAGAALLDPVLADLLVLVVTLSMAATPLLLALYDALARGRKKAEPAYDAPEPGDIIIAGFGRVGQIVARVLRAKGLRFTALDVSSEQVDFVARYGSRIYYGDAARLDLLRAAGAENARAFVLAIDDVDASLRTAELVRQHFPRLPIYARARNRQHVFRLMDLGVRVIERDTFLSSLELTRRLLRDFGLSEREAAQAIATFRAHDERRLYDEYAHYTDEERMFARAKAAAQQLEELFAQDQDVEGR
jgi:glutathione-regulated potassium-efflux system ancillary protein KefC/glutathione-regulated potassium-efflux system protein KefB